MENIIKESEKKRCYFFDVGGVLEYPRPEIWVNDQLSLINNPIYTDIYSLSKVKTTPDFDELLVQVARKYGLKERYEYQKENLIKSGVKQIAQYYKLADFLADEIAKKHDDKAREEVRKITHIIIFHEIIQWCDEKLKQNNEGHSMLLPECDPWQVKYFAKEFSTSEDRIIRLVGGEKSTSGIWESDKLKDYSDSTLLDDLMKNIEVAAASGVNGRWVRPEISKIIFNSKGEIDLESQERREAYIKSLVLNPHNSTFR